MDVAQVRGERRWPPALAIVVLIAIPFLLSKHVFPRALWWAAPIEIALLVAITIIDPGRIDRRSQLLRGLSIVLTMLLAAMAAVGTVWLVVELVDGATDLEQCVHTSGDRCVGMDRRQPDLCAALLGTRRRWLGRTLARRGRSIRISPSPST